MKKAPVITIANAVPSIRMRLAIEIMNALDSLGMRATLLHDGSAPEQLAAQYDTARFKELEILRGFPVQVMGIARKPRARRRKKARR